jgi:hypothetical protein
MSRDATWRLLVSNLLSYREDVPVHGNPYHTLAPAPKLERRPPVKVRVVRPFWAGGRVYQAGETAVLDWPDAQAVLACGRAVEV